MRQEGEEELIFECEKCGAQFDILSIIKIDDHEFRVLLFCERCQYIRLNMRLYDVTIGEYERRWKYFNEHPREIYADLMIEREHLTEQFKPYNG